MKDMKWPAVHRPSNSLLVLHCVQGYDHAAICDWESVCEKLFPREIYVNKITNKICNFTAMCGILETSLVAFVQPFIHSISWFRYISLGAVHCPTMSFYLPVSLLYPFHSVCLNWFVCIKEYAEYLIPRTLKESALEDRDTSDYIIAIIINPLKSKDIFFIDTFFCVLLYRLPSNPWTILFYV